MHTYKVLIRIKNGNGTRYLLIHPPQSKKVSLSRKPIYSSKILKSRNILTLFDAVSNAEIKCHIKTYIEICTHPLSLTKDNKWTSSSVFIYPRK